MDLPTPDEPTRTRVEPGRDQRPHSFDAVPVIPLVAMTGTPTAISASCASAIATSTGFAARSTFVRRTTGCAPESQAVARYRSSAAGVQVAVERGRDPHDVDVRRQHLDRRPVIAGRPPLDPGPAGEDGVDRRRSLRGPGVDHDPVADHREVAGLGFVPESPRELSDEGPVAGEHLVGTSVLGDHPRRDVPGRGRRSRPGIPGGRRSQPRSASGADARSSGDPTGSARFEWPPPFGRPRPLHESHAW